MRRTALLLAAALAATGCTSHPRKPDPGAEENAARARLAVLAQATANGSYDATYDFTFVQSDKPKQGTIEIVQRPPLYRIDVIGSGTDVASFYALEDRLVSCARKAKKKSCFLVGKPGEEIPAVFDPGVQRLFHDAVADLAANPTTYRVRAVPAPPSTATPTPGVPSTGECFDVGRDTTPDPDQPSGFEAGVYCFAEAGYATRIEVGSGTLALRSVGAPPDDEDFKPFAPVATLPVLSATPTP